METSMVANLESEVYLLVRELQARDRELNSMVLSHQQQLSRWTMDRECLLLIREQLTRAEERCVATERELRHAQEGVESCRKEVEGAREDCECRLERERDRVAQLEERLSGLRSENQILTTSLRSAESRIEELSSNEVELRNALALSEQGRDQLEEQLGEEVSRGEGARVLRGETEQLREELNASRGRTVSLSQQLEFSCRDLDREREVSREREEKWQRCVSTLEGKLEVFRTAEERKSQLLASCRSKQEGLERELRVAREMVDRNLSQDCKISLNGLSTPLQIRSDISPQRPTRDISPSSPRSPSCTMDDPFPPLPSPVPPFLRPNSLEIIRDVDDETDGDITQEVDRVTASFELKLEDILHSIDPPRSPRQLSSLSAIPEEDVDTLKQTPKT